MRVLQNIENYAMFPEGADDEYKDNYRYALRGVYNDLLPIRNDQAKTEEYFFKRLWPDPYPTTHVSFNKMYLYSTESGEGHTVRKYVDRKDFLHSLSQVFSSDQSNFGYILSLIKFAAVTPREGSGDEALQEARKHYPSKEEIQYAIDVDIDDLWAESRKIPILSDRIEFLEKKLEASRNLNIPGNVVKEKVEVSIEMKIKELKEMDKRINKNVQRLVEPETAKPIRHSSHVIYFNFWGDEFETLQAAARRTVRKSDEEKMILEQKANTEKLTEWFIPQFHSLIAASQLDAEYTFSSTRTFLNGLMRDFVPRLCKTYNHLDINILSDIADWARKAQQAIQKAHSEAEKFVNDLLSEGDLGENEEGHTLRNLSFYHYQMSQYANVMALSVIREVSEKNGLGFHNIVLYNHWGHQYESRRAAAIKKLIRSDDERKIVDVVENYASFGYSFDLRAPLLEKDVYNSRNYIEHRNNLTGWLHDLGSDYAQRLLDAGIANNRSLKFAMESWTVCTWLAIYAAFDNLKNRASDTFWENQDFSENAATDLTTALNNYMMVSGDCAEVLDKMRSEFNRNVDEVIPEEKKTYVPAPLPEEEDEEEEEVEAPESTPPTNPGKYLPKGMCQINVKVIYDFIKNKGKTSLRLEDYQYAIDYADFAKLLEDAKVHQLRDYPSCIICKLRDRFEDDWYRAACESIGKSPTVVSGYHKTGTMYRIDKAFPANLTM